jgi:predicted nucleotidyltransferase
VDIGVGTSIAIGYVRLFWYFCNMSSLLFEKYQSDIMTLCANHKVKKLYAFGSVLTDRFTAQSDIDLIVEFNDMDVLLYAENYFELKFGLQDLLHSSIDLLEEQAIKNPYFKNAIASHKQLVYEC